MKRSILISLCALFLLSCKKDNSDNEPVAFRLLTRTPVFIGNSSYMLKGSIVAENKLEISEAGFYYSGATTGNTTTLDYNSAGTTHIQVLKAGTSHNVNFEIKALLQSGFYYNIATYMIMINKATNQNILYTGQQVQIKVP